MTKKDHHLLCLGLLAKIGIQAMESEPGTQLSPSDYQAVREAIASAEEIGLPVKVSLFDARKPICSHYNN